MAESSPRRRLPLRYSLRVLLVAFTAFAIGFPIWYRWPYVEEVVETPAGPRSAVKRIEITTEWQRQWGGDRLKHGVERTVWDGVTTLITTYDHGKKHGPHQGFYIKGPLSETGEYFQDQKHGLWTRYNDDGSIHSTWTWERGQLEGPATLNGKSGNHRLEFAGGRIVKLDDKPVHDRLATLVADGKVDSPAVIDVLKSPIGAEYIDVPIQFVADQLSRVIRVSMCLDPLHVDPKQRINCNSREIDFSSCLTVMAAKYGLGCDYRYGAIWITSPEDAMDWRDPTGVADVGPPKDTLLAGAWNEAVNVRAAQQPLADVLSQVAAQLAIEVDISQLAPAASDEPAYPVTLTVQKHPFRHVLGILLYKTRCRCRLEGESLVILPPDDSGGPLTPSTSP